MQAFILPVCLVVLLPNNKEKDISPSYSFFERFLKTP